MKSFIFSLCFLFIATGSGFAQLVRKKDMARIMEQINTEHETFPQIPGLPPISTVADKYSGEIKKYYPSEVYNRDNMMRDTLFFDHKMVLIYQSPLLDFVGITDSLIRKGESRMLGSSLNSMAFITCKREFTVRWLIKNDSLFIENITQQGLTLVPDPEYQASLLPEERTVYPSDRTLMKRLERMTGIPCNDRGMMFAGWVNGKIAGGVNGLYVHYKLNILPKKPDTIYSGHYIYPEEYWFEVENGIIKRVKRKML